ncbi:hypothetical protein DFP73DRAFT_582950 [Morchella snyderi]|nr:hypothetical protein DFP73DRAFT_582950 [Morchella snyderi]
MSSPSGAPLIDMPKLTISNYSTWAPLMKNLLKINLIWGLVQGREGTPSLSSGSSRQEMEHFHMRQDLATSQIFLNCDSEVQAKIADFDDPAELWQCLKDMSEKAVMVDEYWLRKKLYSIEVGECGSVAAYVGLIQDTINLINTCNPKEPIGPAQHCFVLCDGLSAEWLPFIGELHRAGKTCRKPEELIKLFLEHEVQLNREKEMEKERKRSEVAPVPPEPERVQERSPVRESPPEPVPEPVQAGGSGGERGGWEVPVAEPAPEAARNILVRSRHRFFNIRDTKVNFYYAHPSSSILYNACYSIPAFRVITDHIHELYPELCRQIYTNDRRNKVIIGNEEVGDVAIYIKSSTGEHGGGDTTDSGSGSTANCGSSATSVDYSSTTKLGSEEGSTPPASTSEAVVEKKKLIDWIFETPGWKQLLLDSFWEFPGGNGTPTYTLEVEYEDTHRISIFFDHEREFESLGVSLGMFFPPEGDMEL